MYLIFRHNKFHSNAMNMRKAVFFALVICSIDYSSAVTHSLRYVHTGTSGIPNFPEFVTVGLLDGEPFTYFDSKIRRETPRQDWVTQAVDADYWDRNTQISIGTEQVFSVSIEIVKGRFNQTGGVHTLQMMYGCELNDDGTTQGYEQYGYDGADFLSLDMEILTWTAANQKAFITKQHLDPIGVAQQEKNYLKTICIEWLKKYVGYGKDTIERKVRPDVFLLQSADSLVTCQATGFYPSGVVMSWQRDGVDLHKDVEMGLPVPNGDGTFQMRSRLRVTPEDLQKHVYTCTVQHSSSELSVVKTVNQGDILRNKSPGNSLLIPIIIAVVALLLVAAVVGGFVFWRSKKSKSGFVPANTSDDGSSSSNNTAPQC